MTQRRFLFFLYHPGYLRHYREPIRILAAQGHTFHLAFTLVEKDAGDLRLAEELVAELPGVTWGPAPTRAYFDGWRRTALLVRAFTDLARYIDPRYEGASALRERMAVKIKLYVASGKADPFTQRLLGRLVDRLNGTTDAASAKRWLRFLRAAERAIPSSRRIEAFMRADRPDCVIVTPLVEYASTQVEYLKTARKLGIPTVAAIASWDNLTNKGLLRFDPERVLVWNDMQRRELEEMHGVSGDKAVLTGAQKFDEWFERRPTWSPEELKERVGLDPAQPFVLYTCSSRFIAPDERPFVRSWLHALRASGDPALERIGVIVRPHPQNSEQWAGVDLGDANAVVHPAAGAQPDAGVARSEFFDSIAHSAAVVGVNTSAMVESAILGKNVLSVLDPAFAATQEGTLHFHYLLRENGGFLVIARTLDEHVAQLRELLAHGAEGEEQVKEFVQSFVRPHGLDVAAAPLVAQALLEACELPAAPPPRTSPALVGLRALLYPVTLAATASGLIGIVLHRLRGDSAASRVSPDAVSQP